MIKLSKTEYFNLLFCIYHVIYKKLKTYLYDQSELKMYTYKIPNYKYDKSKLI